MDAKKLKSGKKIESEWIPLQNNDGTSMSNIIDSVLSYYGKLQSQVTTKGTLKYAADHLKDAGREKKYTKIIADKWNLPDNIITDTINGVKAFVVLPLLSDMYGTERKKKEIQKELSSIHKLIMDIETGSIDTLEITLKATIKGVSSDIHLKSGAVVRKIFECLKSLPKAEIKQQSKGRPKGVSLEIRMQKHIAKKIQETDSSLFKSQNELCEFIGYCFIAAGIYEEEISIKKQSEFKEDLISKIKYLLKD